MTHPIIKTDNYILITSDEEIKEGDVYIQGYGVYSNIVFGKFTILSTLIGSNPDVVKNHCKKIIAHLPLNNEPILEGVTLLPPLPNEDDEIIENLENYLLKVNQLYKDWLGIGFKGGYHKAKEKYKFTEEDMIKAFEYGKTLKGYDCIGDLIESLSQPKLPVGFNCEMNKTKDSVFYNNDVPYSSQIIINGMMQGEWIFE